LDAFSSEVEVVEPPPNDAVAAPHVEVQSKNNGRRQNNGLVALWAAVIVLGATLAAAAATWQYQRRASAKAEGTLVVHTNPSGAELRIAGAVVGRTPLSMNLAPGSYRVQVGSGAQQRDLDVTLAPGASVQHQLDLPPAVVPVAKPASGALRVQTNLTRLTVTVDGVDRGTAPLTIEGLPLGEHQVVVRGESRTFRETVTIKPQETLTLVISPVETPNTVSAGWLTVYSPVTMQIRENGQLVGTTETAKFMFASGDHEIELANEPLGYRTVRRVKIASGQTAAIAVELPKVMLSINAQPWAEVWMNGERVGETPIANLPARLGSHEVVLRHPQLGERRETVLVTLHQPARLGVDMRRQ
jgi:hypothetical protein